MTTGWSWLDLEMTGLDVERHVIVEIAVLVTDAELEPLDDGIDLVVHQPPDALAEMDDFVRRCTRSRGCSPRSRRRRRRSPTPARRTLEYVHGARARAGDRAAVRQLHRRRPPVPRPLAARARRVPALPQHRRVVAQGAVPALVPGGLQEAAGQGRDAPRARRHPRVDRRAALLPRAHCCRPRRTPTRPQAEELAERAEERGDRALARRVAHEADAPALPANSPRPPPTSMS